MKELFNQVKPVGVYGIPYLDSELQSINLGELVLIGGQAGTGKSTMAQRIAVANSERGVKTALFSLENSKGDTMRKEVYINYRQLSKDWSLTFRKFNIAMANGTVDEQILDTARMNAEHILKNVWLFEKPEAGFTPTELGQKFAKAKEDGCKLVIIDHLDYFDQEVDDNRQEYQFFRELMKQIRALMEGNSDDDRIPVVAFSQFRRPTDQKMIIPTIYDFAGSSDKARIATTVITFSRNYEDTASEQDKTKIHTFISIRKDRFGYAGVADCVFDLKTNKYTNQFRKGYVDEWGHHIKYEV